MDVLRFLLEVLLLSRSFVSSHDVSDDSHGLADHFGDHARGVLVDDDKTAVVVMNCMYRLSHSSAVILPSS